MKYWGQFIPFVLNIQVVFVRFPNILTHHTDTRIIFFFVSTVSTLQNMRSVRNGSSQTSLMLMKSLLTKVIYWTHFCLICFEITPDIVIILGKIGEHSRSTSWVLSKLPKCYGCMWEIWRAQEKRKSCSQSNNSIFVQLKAWTNSSITKLTKTLGKSVTKCKMQCKILVTRSTNASIGWLQTRHNRLFGRKMFF